MEPERLIFDLVGKRSYVRSTDVLRSVLQRLPARGLTLKFLRPLSGPALLSDAPSRHTAVTVSSASSTYVLINAPQAKTTRVAERAVPTPALRIKWARWHIFLFPPRASIADRIERCFDIVHPQLGETYIVRSIRIVSPRAAFAPVLWFRIHRAASADRAHLIMYTPFGWLAEVNFKLAPRTVPFGLKSP